MRIEIDQPSPAVRVLQRGAAAETPHRSRRQRNWSGVPGKLLRCSGYEPDPWAAGDRREMLKQPGTLPGQPFCHQRRIGVRLRIEVEWPEAHDTVDVSKFANFLQLALDGESAALIDHS